MTTAIGFKDVFLVSPLIFLFILSLIPITIKVLRGNVEPTPSGTLLLGLFGLFGAGILLQTVGAYQITAFEKALVFDGLTKWLGLLVLAAAAASLLLAFDNPSTKGDQFSELVFLTLNTVSGMLILLAAYDLLSVFIGLETMSLCLYLMIAMSHEQKKSKEAALKYFILGSFASAIFLYGISFVFGTVGTTYIDDIVKATPTLIASSRVFLFGMTFLILGFCFKVSIAPFHAWTPDVYEGAPTPHTALMATAVKAVSFGAFLRIISAKSLIGSENLLDLLQWLAVITMIAGNVAAVIQNNVKRMLAYSSVAHSGYLLVGIITAGYSDKIQVGAAGLLFYLTSYVLMTLGAFASVSLIEKNENASINIDDLAGYAKENPVMAFCLTLFLLSLAGIPPLVGFFGKFYLFNAALAEGLLWLVVWGVLSSVISAYFYLRPIVYMYMKESENTGLAQPLLATRAVILGSALLVVCLGLVSGPLFELFEKALL